jgi:hypothetical protein
MQGVNDVAGGFARHFPGVEGLSGGGDFHGFRKAEWTGLRPLLKVREFAGEFVFALGNVLGQVGGFAIALEAETDVSRSFSSDQDMRAEAQVDMGLLVIIATFCLPVK